MLCEMAVGSNQSIVIFSSSPVNDSCPLDGDKLDRFGLQNRVRRFIPNTHIELLGCALYVLIHGSYDSIISRVLPCHWLGHLNKMSGLQNKEMMLVSELGLKQGVCTQLYMLSGSETLPVFILCNVLLARAVHAMFASVCYC